MVRLKAPIQLLHLFTSETEDRRIRNTPRHAILQISLFVPEVGPCVSELYSYLLIGSKSGLNRFLKTTSEGQLCLPSYGFCSVQLRL
ncbi:predicted protein [Histoplasma mississippiense (nom. inval.)]|uniref:predicted protein n=1 Tax=Ajellomyces capsulatus (strain NAm1 / WU24) TaxID=2059318 RepID=UPI000157C3A0|nr:predicted protein [Histoplasma mississippiense (nom. inval.)]EDN07277.1 predicted protein [Histoplasma mississippiense (nom. inval.)]